MEIKLNEELENQNSEQEEVHGSYDAEQKPKMTGIAAFLQRWKVYFQHVRATFFIKPQVKYSKLLAEKIEAEMRYTYAEQQMAKHYVERLRTEEKIQKKQNKTNK